MNKYGKNDYLYSESEFWDLPNMQFYELIFCVGFPSVHLAMEVSVSNIVTCNMLLQRKLIFNVKLTSAYVHIT